MVDQYEESPEERESRLLLIKFLTVADPLLDRCLQHLIMDSKVVLDRTKTQLRRIWAVSRENLRRVIHTIQNGLSRSRRAALNQVGMFRDALAAKFELLSFDIQEGAIKRILMRLNSMLGSLAKVFPALHAVKEFKDHVEATIEGLNDSPAPISLKDLLEQQ